MSTTKRPHTDTAMQDIEQEFQRRLETHKMDLKQALFQQQQVFGSTMMRIPKSVKSMKVSEFNAIYKIDLVKLVQGKKAMLAAGGKSLTTPLKPTNQANLTTPSRNLRRGEQLFSENGSPVETAEEGALVATVTKKSRQGAVTLQMNLQGKTLSLKDADLDNLDQETKNQTMNQILAMQQEMANLMAKLQG